MAGTAVVDDGVFKALLWRYRPGLTLACCTPMNGGRRTASPTMTKPTEPSPSSLPDSTWSWSGRAQTSRHTQCRSSGCITTRAYHISRAPSTPWRVWEDSTGVGTGASQNPASERVQVGYGGGECHDFNSSLTAVSLHFFAFLLHFYSILTSYLHFC